MPKVTQQRGGAVNGRVRRSAPADSVLSRAVPVSELQDDFLKFCIYGRNRVGKTWLACQFPKPLLLIAFEPTLSGGAKTVKKVPGVTYLRITEADDALRLAEELRKDVTYKTHVLDTATSYQDLFLKKLLGLPAVPEQLDWGIVSDDQYRERSSMVKEGMRPFLDLNAHTVILAQEKDHNAFKERGNKAARAAGFDGQGSTLQLSEAWFAQDLGGAAAQWLNDACDYITQLYVVRETVPKTVRVKVGGQVRERTEWVETGKMVRRLRCLYHTNFAAGFRSEHPDAVPEFIPNPTWEKIKAVVDGKTLK